ncbi:hypothetical protein ALQ94_102439 [Pseudomonas amygdali pv. morsprunorum]|uniref:Uncharacterized protein n=1 Tax=Pseudomonas amygdali pv. morsprunorum TaxID=129138 RepID=A0A3M2WN85_PSEA0|nr:hypothetical protein ALQ94_102439 [Pseudomonas amygdali pv. morsprunorum]
MRSWFFESLKHGAFDLLKGRNLANTDFHTRMTNSAGHEQLCIDGV